MTLGPFNSQKLVNDCLTLAERSKFVCLRRNDDERHVQSFSICLLTSDFGWFRRLSSHLRGEDAGISPIAHRCWRHRPVNGKSQILSQMICDKSDFCFDIFWRYEPCRQYFSISCLYAHSSHRQNLVWMLYPDITIILGLT